jgi:hypothetical protein
MTPRHRPAPKSAHILTALLALSLAACGQPPAPPAEDPLDPAVAAALGDQIMVDPDLIGQNNAGSVADLSPGLDGMPTLDTGSAAIGRARDEALAMLGGAAGLRRAPAPKAVAGALPPGAALTAAGRAAAAPGTGASCAQGVQYAMAWAARLPAPFPVYPRAAVQEAAGNDTGGCALRAINFQTPVPLQDVVDFYYSRALAAGYSAERVQQDGDDVLAGTKGQATYALYARRLPTGATEVDLVTSGG